MASIGIIGGGLSALSAAWQLKKAGHTFTLLDVNKSLGGAVRTDISDGWLVEHGPNTLQVNSVELESLLNEMGVLDTAIEANPKASKRYLVRNKKPIAAPMSPLQAVFSPLLSLSAKFNVALEPFRTQANYPTETLASFVRRRLGQEFLDQLINPMVGGVYAGDPEELCVRHAFPKVYNLEAYHGSLIRGAIAKQKEKKQSGSKFKTKLLSWPRGMGQLVEELSEPLGQDMMSGVKLVAIEKKKRWHVYWLDGMAEYKEKFDHLIFAMPVHALSKLPFVNGGFEEKLKPLAKIPYPPVTVMAMGFKKEDVPHPLDGFGCLIPERERCYSLGTLFSSTLFPERAPEGHVLLTSFVGGQRQPENARQTLTEIETGILNDFRTLYGIKAQPVFKKHIHWERAIPQYRTDHDEHLNTLTEIEKEIGKLSIIGNFRGGIAAGQCLLNGAECAKTISKEYE